MNRVVITGLGAVTAIGNTVSEYWENLIAGKGGISPITRISTEEHDTKVAAQVPDSFEAEASRYWKKRQLSATTRATRTGLASAGEAVADSGIDFTACDHSRVAVIYGVIDNSLEDAELDKPLNITLRKMPSELPAMVSIKYGLTGAAFNVSTACASSAYAMAIAKQMIEAGMYDTVIVGGVSNTVTHSVIKGFNQLLAMSVNPDPETACRPFTRDRDGFIMGEGAGTLILESEQTAKARGARIYCTLAGAHMDSEAYNMTAPKTDGAGMAQTMAAALENAGLQPEHLDYINAHGTSTPLNDAGETAAVKTVFGDHAYQLAISSTKSMTGHLLGAAGGVESVFTAMALHTGWLPGTINLENPDPNCDLDYMAGGSAHIPCEYAMCNSFGFGGTNASLILKKWND